MSSTVQIARHREKLTILSNPVTVIGMKDVICSGVIVSRGNEPISFMPFGGPASKFFIALTFQTESSKGSSLDIKYPENSLAINFVNMNSALEQGTSAPVPMFIWDGDLISINIAFHTVGGGEGSTRVVNYTIFNSVPLKPDTN